MSNSKSKSLRLLKSIAYNTKSMHARTESMKSAYKMSPADSSQWFLEISTDPDQLDVSTVACLLRLLPDMATHEAAVSAKIFFNLLKSGSDVGESGGAPFPKPDSYAVSKGKELVADLLSKAPQEFSKAVLDIALWGLGMMPSNGKPYPVDVQVSPRHLSQARHHGSLLAKMEEKLTEWHDAGDERADSVLGVLASEPHALAKLVLLETLVRDPARHAQLILDTVTSTIGVSGPRDEFGRYLEKTLPVCGNEQVKDINCAFLNAGLSRDRKTELHRRRFLLLAIPERFRTADAKKWLETHGAAPEAESACQAPEPPARVEPGQEAYADPKDVDGVLDVLDAADSAQKPDLLVRMARLLEASSIGRERLKKLENILRSCFLDYENHDRSNPNLRALASVVQEAALCHVLLTAQNASPDNIRTCKTLSTHRDALVRVGVAKGLARLSEADFESSFSMAQRLARDHTPVPAYLEDYMYRIKDNHAQETLQLCKLLVETRGKDRGLPYQDRAVCVAVSIIAQKALKGDDPSFSSLFYNIVHDDSYNHAVKHYIAFLCQILLRDDRLSGKLLAVYSALLDSADPHVRGDAEFFLLYTLAEIGKPLLPQIRPVLEKASCMTHETPSNPSGPILAEYLAKFWQEIPKESVEYIGRLCRNNPSTTVYDLNSSSILDTMEAMFKSDLLDRRSKQSLLETLMLFVRAGWARANRVLGTAESCM